MANEQKGRAQPESAKRQPPPATIDDDMSEQDQREMSQSQNQSQRAPRSDDGHPDRVEIGDPVPEDDRTIKARETGETGEDEDLPSTDTRIETPSERH